MNDPQLPPGWQGSYGTLNTRQALAEINRRLCALDAPGTALHEQPRSAVMIRRAADGRFEGKHVTVFYTEPLDFAEAQRALAGGNSLVFVRPQDAGLLLDTLEAERHADAPT